MESTRDGDGDIAVCDPGVLHSKASAQSSSWPMRHSSRRRCRSCDNNTRTNAACRAVYTARGDTAAMSSEVCREALILACRTSHGSVLSVASNLLLRPNMLPKPHVSHFHVHTQAHRHRHKHAARFQTRWAIATRPTPIYHVIHQADEGRVAWSHLRSLAVE